MRMLAKVFLILVVGAAIGFANSAGNDIVSYDNYQVLRVSPQNEAQYNVLVELYDGGKFDFWAKPSKISPADILIDPGHQKSIQEYFQVNEIPFTTMIPDVGRLISEQKINHDLTSDMNWDDYQTIETIYDWLDSLVISHPNLVSITTIGQSTEGRDLKVVKISTGGDNKTAFWIDATIHAREWIAPSTATYIINELVTKSENYAHLLSVLDFYILPIINTDGYVYTHTTDRMWRKTRSDHDSPFGCRGVDANRNFGFHWGERGSSNDKCDETYRGPEAYSEPEAFVMKEFIVNNRETIKWDTYITLHSYSQLWMTPWGYTKDLTEDYQELKRLGDEAAEELKSHFGTAYRVGNAASILYYSSGSSRDWAKGEGGFKYVYTLELRDKGQYGFLLPKEQIIPTAIETWAGIQIVAKTYIK